MEMAQRKNNHQKSSWEIKAVVSEILMTMFSNRMNMQKAN